MEVRSEYGETISAHRTSEGTAMFDTRSKLPVHSTDSSLGIVGWLNTPHQMQSHIDLFHVNADRLRSRVQQDAALIHLAQTPLDQLFDLADHITTAEVALAKVRDERSDLSESKREREVREQSLHAALEAQNEGEKKTQLATFGGIGLVVLGAIVAFLVALPVGIGLAVIGLALAAGGAVLASRGGNRDMSAEAMEFQLGRVDELFNTQSLTRDRRSAEDDLAQRREEWRSIAGDAEPSVLIKDRPRIEELASHLQLISHAQVAVPGDTAVLIGFASLLAELSRRFPAERVPLLIDDLFPFVPPQYHAILRELILRASHRRQVVLETEDIDTTKWAAVEAVGSSALVITDYDIDAERIIEEIVSTDVTPSV